MFSDCLFECTELIFKNLRCDNTYVEIYEKNSVIAMLANMQYLILCSSFLISELTPEKKIRLMQYANDCATQQYSKHMDIDYDSNDDE